MIKEFKTAVVISDHLFPLEVVYVLYLQLATQLGKLANIASQLASYRALDIWRLDFYLTFSCLATQLLRYNVLLYGALATGFVAGSASSVGNQQYNSYLPTQLASQRYYLASQLPYSYIYIYIYYERRSGYIARQLAKNVRSDPESKNLSRLLR